jgi:quercetin dioxygenase-like cupin family protein
MSTYVWDPTGTLHIHSEDVPFVDQGSSGIEIRLLQASADDGVLSAEYRFAPGVVGPLHRHLGPVYGFTSEGRWGHDTNFDYRRGSYIYEVPGIIHRFMSGPDGSVRAFFVEYGGIEAIDGESSEPLVMLGVPERVRLYFNACEAAGLPRPNILL